MLIGALHEGNRPIAIEHAPQIPAVVQLVFLQIHECLRSGTVHIVLCVDDRQALPVTRHVCVSNLSSLSDRFDQTAAVRCGEYLNLHSSSTQADGTRVRPLPYHEGTALPTERIVFHTNFTLTFLRQQRLNGFPIIVVGDGNATLDTLDRSGQIEQSGGSVRVSHTFLNRIAALRILECIGSNMITFVAFHQRDDLITVPLGCRKTFYNEHNGRISCIGVFPNHLLQGLLVHRLAR